MPSGIYEHGGLYKLYDMDGIIEVGTGKLMVHDVFEPTPAFMKEADFVFCDPPCNQSNISSFYTKAEIGDKPRIDDFTARLFEVIDEIGPNTVVMEAFKSNKDALEANLRSRFGNVRVLDSMYYRNPKNKCWLIVASRFPIGPLYDEIDGIDEEDAIARICEHAEYDCIADPCMGKGLVAFYANRVGRKFAGTELNKKRLAVAVDRVTNNARGKIG